MPNSTLDGFNRVLTFDESLTRVFRVTAIVFLRQTLRDVAAVRNLSISYCDQLLNVLVILSHGGGLLLIDLLRTSSGNLAKLAAIRLASSRVSSLAVDRRPGSSSSSDVQMVQ
jgi:hypothetical protein